MKNITKFSTIIFSIILTLSLLISVPSETNIVNAATTNNVQTIKIVKGKSKTIKAPTVKGYKVQKVNYYTVSKKGIVSIKKVKKTKGAIKITAKKAGTTKLNVNYTFKKGNKTKTKKVKYTIKVQKPVAVKSVSISPKTVTLNIGDTTTLKPTITPNSATNKTVTWSSSDKKVVTVKNGNLTAKSKGTATITAKTTNGKKATCKVTVKSNDVSVESITLDKTSLNLEVDETATLTATVKPDNATNKAVTWSSSNSLVASVDSKGVVTAKKAGSATITATAGGKNATAVVTVTDPAGMTYIKWNAVSNATGYLMYRKIKGQADSSYKFLQSETNTWYIDNSTTAKKEYTYKIVPVISTLTESTKLDPIYIEATSVSYGIFHQTAAKEYLAYVNGLREQYNEAHKNDSNFVKREPVVWNESLEKSAMIRATELPVINDHARPDGSHSDIYIVPVLECVGFTENIILSDVCSFAWDGSHNATMARADFTQVGISFYENGNGNLYMAIVFSLDDESMWYESLRYTNPNDQWMSYQKREAVWDGMVGTDGKDTVLKTQLGNYIVD